MAKVDVLSQIGNQLAKDASIDLIEMQKNPCLRILTPIDKTSSFVYKPLQDDVFIDGAAIKDFISDFM